MLKLKKLQMQGFKSFCERTEMSFPGVGVVAIVGPNGCGKSNVADAIGWVLGEQSAKSLRGGRMEDVIFAGTSERAPMGMAEVSLTLTDPVAYEPVADEPEADPAPLAADQGWDDEAAPAPASPEGDAGAPAPAAGGVVLTIRERRKARQHNRRGEIVVTRRLFRSGESEYLMNGRLCRLRDIQELFMGTGLGPESYAIIEQGRIGQILSSKPHERRAVIEEAAGVSRYKAKRRQAEARLEAARLNLNRINDIFEEVTRQVGSLKRQAAKAQRWRELKQELDARQRDWLRVQAAAALAEAAALQQQRDEARQTLAQAEQYLRGLEQERAAQLADCASRELDLRRAGERTVGLQRAQDQAEQQLRYGNEQEAELLRRDQALEQQQREAGGQTAGLAEELTAAAAAHANAGALVAEAAARQQAQREVRQSAAAVLGRLAAELDQARSQQMTALAAAAQAANQRTQAEAARQAAADRLERAQREAAESAAELQAGGAECGQLRLQLESDGGQQSALARQVEELAARGQELARAESAARGAVEQLTTTLAELGARRRSIEEIVAQHGYSSAAVQQLFAAPAAERGFQPLGVLGEFVEVEAPFDGVVEQFLQEELNYVVVGSWEDASAGVGLLRHHAQGRATFLIHGTGAHDAAAGPSANGMPGNAGPGPAPINAQPLASRVRALNGFRQGLGAMLPRLRDAYFCDDSATARALATEHPRDYFLTPNGECFHNITVSGGAGASRGPLSLKRELRELETRQQSAAADLEREQQRLAQLGRERADTERQLEQARTALHELDKRLLSGRQAVAQLEQSLARAQARRQQAQLDCERAQTAERAAAGQAAAAAAQAAEAESRQAALHLEIAAAAEAVAAAQAEASRAAEALAAAQAETARVEERAQAAGAHRERLERLEREAQARLTQLQAERTALAARRSALELQQRQLERELQRIVQDAVAAAAAAAAADNALAAARQRAADQEAAVNLGRAQLDAGRQAANDVEVRQARHEADEAHLRQSCRDALECELEALLDAAADAGTAAPDAAALEQAVHALRMRLEHLGPVNMMALEEYDEAQQRHTFLSTQRDDLLASIADTQKAIAEMDAVSRQKFALAFEQINAYFQESFRLLFGGGQGFLRLSETEGNGDSGVDIVAQPPGKKLQNALLLSGGEKAMTAMALLLAVFRYQPSPFCLLDEVDAPMDEANVIRFSEIIRSMAAHTQFIVITHNKRTMEAAPLLYGVTMAQLGVSRLVSVELDERQRA